MANGNNWKDYVTFSKKERNGFFIVLVIAGIVIAYPFISKKHTEENTTSSQEASKAVALIKENKFFADEAAEPANGKYNIQQDKLTPFDPNNLSREQWISFGLNPKTASTIINYTSKGGRFYKPEDIRKIWGLRKEEADALIPFINIEPGFSSHNSQHFSSASRAQARIIDVNTADASAYKALPGIGDVLSNRIVKYRNAVHGFQNISDIKKVYGISAETYQSILPYLTISNTPNENKIPGRQPAIETHAAVQHMGKVNISTATEKDMIAAGIPRNIARAIKVYRDQHGAFTTTDELKKIVFIEEDAYRQILPLIFTE